MDRRIISRLIALVLFCTFLYLIRGVLFPIVISIILFYVLDPLVQKLSNKWPKGLGINHIVSILIAFLVFTIAVSLFVTIILPPLMSEFDMLVVNLPQFFAGAQQMLSGMQDWYTKVTIPDAINNIIIGALQNILNIIIGFAQLTASTLMGMLSQFVLLIIIPILTFYFLKERGNIIDGIVKLAPEAHRKKLMEIFVPLDGVLHNYVLGQLTLCAAVGFFTGLGLYFLGIKFFVILGLIAAVCELIPCIGPSIGAAPAVVISFFISPWLALKVIVWYIIVQSTETAFLTPRIMGKRLDLGPITVILAILVLSQLIGLWGMFFATPIVAIIKILYLQLRKAD
ncbi:MAG: AI-2E family transporter [Candidatus Saganbacteria bacterium]|nr:AI-2E family transporter [Candidatus Saganbacteria bacterium]